MVSECTDASTTGLGAGRASSATCCLLVGVGAAIAIACLIICIGRTMAADLGPGAQLAASCASCHRLDGRDAGIPSIVALNANELARALRAYKSGERQSMIMHAVALTLSDDEIATIARFVAAQRKKIQP